MCRGEIAVFFSLTVVLVLSFFCSLVETARTQGARLQLELAVDVGCESLFAAYDTLLYESFDVFFFDGSFGDGTVQSELLLEKLDSYINRNLHPKSSFFLQNTDFYQLDIEDYELQQITLASDDDGMVFREEAIRSMKAKYGIELAEELLYQSGILENSLEEGKRYEQELQQNEQSLEALEEEKQEADLQNPIEAEKAKRQENPALVIKQKKDAGVLNLIIEDVENISENGVDKSLLPSIRDLNKGSGYSKYDDSLFGKALFNQYLMDNFSCGTDTEYEKGVLWYELEYLLTGKAHDIDNLKDVVGKLLLAREGVNFVYLLTDSSKMAQAEAMAVTLVGYTGLLPLIKAMKYALLLSWAYAESLLDVKRLLTGKKVALVKTMENWQLELSNITELASCQLKDDEGGISYKDYLRMLLFLEDKEMLAKRCLDLVEIKVRSEKSGERFRVDNMVASWGVLVTAVSDSVFFNPLFFHNDKKWDGTVRYNIKRQFSYGMWK